VALPVVLHGSRKGAWKGTGIIAPAVRVLSGGQDVWQVVINEEGLIRWRPLDDSETQ
jgi:hypothetical protein